MSDSTPSAKRKRTDEPAAERTTLVRSDIWLPFGDIVLQAESTQFRVNRDNLTRHSSVFADMFSVPQPPNEPTVEGCPVVVLSGDSAKDWELLLGVLYGSFEDKEMRPVAEIAAMLRLGRKYGIAAAEANAVQRLHYEYPADLNAWIKIADSPFKKIQDESGAMFQVLSLAYEFGIRSSIPLMAYLCFMHSKPLEQIFTGIARSDGSCVVLPAELRETLAIGFERIMGAQRGIYSWLDDGTVVPSDSCKKSVECTRARQAMHENLAWDDDTGLYCCFALETWDSDWTHTYCKTCFKAAKSAFVASRSSIWESLPGFFGLPDWADLKDAD
ncbi:hypothetical protein FB45DRAFT_909072 [Roridomyces roridus]|uniref:BTB domain-containing protein n=1 Tax=Roridomyces roridus TaxID=1738132 RepID=A0AAD7BYP3_9AGAR|nr:hypothetical protein FB45DRAFT_909072 [Roridomyces roridus]